MLATDTSVILTIFTLLKGKAMKTIEITATGITPLMMNSFKGTAYDGTSGSSAAKDFGTPLQQAQEKLYIGMDGKSLVMPQPNIFSCIVEGGKFFKNGKSKVTTLKTSLIPSCVFFPDVEYSLEYYGTLEVWAMATSAPSDWSVDSRPIRNPSTGGRILRHRPIIHDWRFTFSVELDTNEMSARLFRDIVDAAGSKIGLGDFRPGCKGSYGRWKVTSWVVTDEEAEVNEEEELLEV
jgi:hypothetical protein